MSTNEIQRAASAIQAKLFDISALLTCSDSHLHLNDEGNPACRLIALASELAMQASDEIDQLERLATNGCTSSR